MWSMIDGGRRAYPRPMASSVHVHDERAPAAKNSSGPRSAPHFTPAERIASGKAARAELPRSAHADWEPGVGG
jgi:hypothetical protein